jgi:hypothetical protein
VAVADAAAAAAAELQLIAVTAPSRRAAAMKPLLKLQ